MDWPGCGNLDDRVDAARRLLLGAIPPAAFLCSDHNRDWLHAQL
jgi:hypothetical protein